MKITASYNVKMDFSSDETVMVLKNVSDVTLLDANDVNMMVFALNVKKNKDFAILIVLKIHKIQYMII